ncbi:MAG: type II toxin-antitoxin system Phd/YefM family antitoxin [Campylobacter sp.]|nr:type II toxin-antitoxin system Phd/YefM family antitoxin [Campylobacter sp.]
MTSFTKDEIFTATEVVRNFSSILNKINKGDIKRAVILKNNKFESVLLSMGEYERLCEAVEILQSIYSTTKKED